MIGIILSVVKILGIIILAILALALLIILMVLFIPVRNKGKIYFKEVPDIEFSITWFFKFLSISVKYTKRLDILAKLGWFFRVYSNNEEDLLIEDNEKNAEVDKTKNKKIKGKKSSDNDIDIQDIDSDDDIQSIKNKQKIKVLEQDEKKQTKKNRKKAKQRRKERSDKSSEKESRLDKLINKIKDLHYLISDEENKRILIIMLEKSKKLLVHILPKKIVGYFKFGFDDPSTTGQVLEAIAIFYPLYRDDFKIIPMFYDEIIEVDISFKGRLRIFYAAYIALTLWLNKKKLRKRPE